MNNSQNQFKKFSFTLRIIRQLYDDGILPNATFEEVYSYIYAGDAPLGNRDRRRAPSGSWYTQDEFNRWWGPVEGPQMWNSSEGRPCAPPTTTTVDVGNDHILQDVIEVLNAPANNEQEDGELEAAKGLFGLSLEATGVHQPTDPEEVKEPENVVIDVAPAHKPLAKQKETIRLLTGGDGKGIRGTWWNKKTNQNGFLRVGIDKGQNVRKLKPKAWTEEANALFDVLYPGAVALDQTRSERRALILAHFQKQVPAVGNTTDEASSDWTGSQMGLATC